MTASHSHPELLDLLADAALGELPADERARLADLNPDAARELELAAAALELALLTPGDVGAIPVDVNRRLSAAGNVWAARASLGVVPAGQEAAPPAPYQFPWRAVLTLAAVVALLGVAWIALSPGAPSLDDQRTRLLASVADAVQLTWSPWDNPETGGVTGDIVWSDSTQTGYMRFVNLPVNDPSKEQYQLWIIDERGMEQRISGGIFNASGSETIVPITPGIRVKGAAAFAVTVEKPGGTWVSDMKRRVVIAAKS